MLDAKINTRTNHSNVGVSTTDKTAVLKFVQHLPHFELPHDKKHGHLKYKLKWNL